MAMMFLAIASALALGMYAASTTATATANNLVEGERARAAAESGLRWITWRFERMSRPKTPVGNITPAVATTLWPAIRTAVASDVTAMLIAAERMTSFDGTTFKTASIAVDE